MLVTEDQSVSFADGQESFWAGEFADINEVADCREVFVEQASAMMLREAWFCVYNVELL